MSRILLLVLSGLALSVAAFGQSARMPEGSAQTRQALSDAVAARDAAAARSAKFEAQARNAEDKATRAAREAAALAARIQQAEAGIVAQRARIALIDDNRAQLREELGREQQPIIHLTAALQQFARRPLALSLLRPGEVRDVVYLRALLANTVPHVRGETRDLRQAIVNSRQLRDSALAAAAGLRAEEKQLGERRKALAIIETRQRLAARQAGSAASREAERALALAENARDLDGLVGELDRAAALRDRLAALPGPRLRPANPEQASLAAPAAAAPLAASNAPRPYLLPVAGRVVTGFGAPVEGGFSRGLTLAPLSGAQVVAPAKGRIAFAGPYRGFGNIVIIEHSGSWTTLVTGLSRADIAIGEEIGPGAPLGKASTQKPRITVELRREGEPVNPIDFAR